MQGAGGGGNPSTCSIMSEASLGRRGLGILEDSLNDEKLKFGHSLFLLASIEKIPKIHND